MYLKRVIERTVPIGQNGRGSVIKMFKQWYTRFVEFSVNRPWWVIGAAALVTLFFIWQAATLKISMTWVDMMPQNEPMVREYQRLIKMFGTTDMIMAVVEASSEEQAIALVKQTAERLSKLVKWVKRVDYTIDTEFIRKHGLMLSRPKDLKRLKRILADPNLLPWLTAINDDFEREYIEDSGNLKKDESKVVRQINALGILVDTLSRLSGSNNVSESDIAKVVDRLTIGDTYMLSTDRKMALLIIQPTFTADDTDLACSGVRDMQEIIDEIEQENQGSWIAITGMSVIAKDEMVTAQEDSRLITLGALIIITALFIVTFRMWTSPLLAMLILIVGILWDYGLAGMIIGRLTMFSTMSALLLIGLGVDYLMHFLSGFFEARVEGKNACDSILQVYRTSGKGIILGGITTAIVFFSMTISDFPAMEEFGITMGLGIITCMSVTLLILPSIMILRERYLLKRAVQGKKFSPFSAEFKFLSQTAAMAYKRPWLSIGIIALATIFMGWGITKLGFDRNYLNAEAKGLESVALYDIMSDRFDMSADALIFTENSLAAAEEKMYQLDEITTVGSVESIARYLPSAKSQAERRPYVKAIHKQVAGKQYQRLSSPESLAEELKRLSDNIVEMGQMGYLNGLTKITKQCDLLTGLDNEGNQKKPNRILAAAEVVKNIDSVCLDQLNRGFFKYMQANILSMANPAEIKLEEIREDIRDRFISKDGKFFSVQAFSRKNVYKNETTYIEDVHSVAPQATGVPAIFRRLIVLSAEKGKSALLLATVLIIVFLLLAFRSVKYTMLALLPMALAYVFMFGTLGWLNMPLTIASVMMLPLIVGIGIDDGIHLIHRYHIEGPGSQPKVVSSTGKAIFLSTATTMLGFGSLISAKYQGFGQMGWLTLIGIGWCFVMSIILIPTILCLMEGRK